MAFDSWFPEGGWPEPAKEKKKPQGKEKAKKVANHLPTSALDRD
jgi:hypothetical protein